MTQLLTHLVIPGSIIYCIKWPPYPIKPRPVLILAIVRNISDKPWVLAAQGTAQRTTEKNGNTKSYEFEISSLSSKKYSLQESTIFNFTQVFPIKLTEEYFSNIISVLKTPEIDSCSTIYLQNKKLYEKYINLN